MGSKSRKSGLNSASGGSGGGGGGSTKLPLPLALLLCFSFFFAGCFYGGRRYSNLPDLKSGKAAKTHQVGAGEGQQVLQQQQQPQQAGRKGLAANLEGAGASARRQLAADGSAGLDAAAAGVSGAGAVVDGLELTHSPDAASVLAYPHGETGSDFMEDVPFQMISWHPRAYVFPNFAPPEKCDDIVNLAKKSLAPSGLALRAGESAEATKDIRTSSGTFLSSRMDPSGSLAWVENKMARVSMIPPEHGEAFNVLRYELGQKYDSHMDVFDPKEYGPQSSNRVASFLLYLTDVEEGGETMFPYEGYNNMNIGYNFKDCIGLRVKPKKGDALLFWSMFPNGTIDPTSLHGSCPVIKGEKWVATKWIRDHPSFMRRSRLLRSLLGP